LPREVFVISKYEDYKIFVFGGAGNPNISYCICDFGRYYFLSFYALFKIAEKGLKSLQILIA